MSEKKDADQRIPVTSVEEFSPGMHRIVEMGNQEVGVFNIDGEYHALANYCPHRGGPLCEGESINALVGEWPGPGERTVERYNGNPAITCPWHGWEFDIETGVHLGDESISVQKYNVIVEDDIIYITK